MPSTGEAHRILTTIVSTPREVPTELEHLQRRCKAEMLLGPSTSHWWTWSCPRALPHGLRCHSAPPLNRTHEQQKRRNIQEGCFRSPCCLEMAPGRIYRPFCSLIVNYCHFNVILITQFVGDPKKAGRGAWNLITALDMATLSLYLWGPYNLKFKNSAFISKLHSFLLHQW